MREYQVLKTTQSGYAGFLHDQFTLLPDTNERILATSLTAYWKYGPRKPRCYEAAYKAAKWVGAHGAQQWGMQGAQYKRECARYKR